MKRTIFALLAVAALVVSLSFNSSNKEETKSDEINTSNSGTMKPYAMSDSNF